MSGIATAEDLDDLLGPSLVADELPPENLVDEAPKSRPMGAASRAVVERSRSYPVMRAADPLKLQRLQRICRYMSETGVAQDACRRLGINYSTLKYWLQKSTEGAPGDGYDMPISDRDEGEGDTQRFHIAWDFAVEAGVGLVESAVHARARGYDEVQVYKGRIQYQLDPDRVDVFRTLGLPIDDRDAALWLRDEFGAAIPVTVRKMDPDLAMFVLKTRKPKEYGAKATMDVNVKGGVLVVGMQATSSQALNELEDQYRREGRQAVTFDEGDGDL